MFPKSPYQCTGEELCAKMLGKDELQLIRQSSMRIRSIIKSSFRALGYDIHKLRTGRDYDMHIHKLQSARKPFHDISQLIGSQSSPRVFDVGANLGQTIESFREVFPRPTIHAFEPGPQTFRELQAKHSATPGVSLNNCALGAELGTLEFIENTSPDMSSFLEPGATSWGDIKNRIKLNVNTIDGYCTERGIDAIDVLKSDTQGYELEVIKGAERLLSQRRIHLIYIEIIFSEMYRGFSRFDQIFDSSPIEVFPSSAFTTFIIRTGLQVGPTPCLSIQNSSLRRIEWRYDRLISEKSRISRAPVGARAPVTSPPFAEACSGVDTVPMFNIAVSYQKF